MNVALSAVGRAKQTAKGNAVAAPTSWHGVEGGKLVSFDVEQSADEITTGLAAGVGEFREGVAVAGDWTARAWPLSIGEALLAILGNVATTGASAPYTHVFTLGDTIPYYTLFGKMDTEIRRAADCKLDELGFSFDGNKPVKVNETWGGCTPSWPASITPPAAAANETLSPYFSAGAGTFKLAVSGTTLVPAKALSGSLSLKRAIESDIIAGTLAPDDVHEGALVCEIDMSVRVPDMTAKRQLLTGSTSGTTISAEPIYGSFEWGFALGTSSLKLEGTKAAFSAEDIEADPKGGPATLSLKGGLYIPAGGNTPLTATLVNGRASY